MSHTPTTGCGCCLEPVDDAKEACDLCSEATGMDDGVGWRIRQCRLHAAAPDLLAACKAIIDEASACSTAGNVLVSEELIEQTRAAIAKAEQGGAA